MEIFVVEVKGQKVAIMCREAKDARRHARFHASEGREATIRTVHIGEVVEPEVYRED